jgi:lantibiotic leader peptide-processing serine protease
MIRSHVVPRAAILVAIAVLGSLLLVPSGNAADTGVSQTYLVVFKAQSLPSNSASIIRSAGGTVSYSYPQIGVVVAQSSSSTFRASLMRNTKIQGASATAAFATQLTDGAATDDGTVADADIPATDSDSLSGLQWDMVQIHTPEAHAITGGSPSVVVGDIDTGLDYTHPDLAPNVDFADSVSCVSGVPDTNPAAWNDDNGHGTHTAGTIAAASNGIGIVGVAPNVKIAGIKAGNAAGFFFPEAVVCAFMWAGTHGIDVTNNSYFADPWLFNCKNDPAQRAIWIAEQRAILFAENKGTVVVAAAGNEADDLAHPTQDVTSPDDTTPIVRSVTNACAVVPVEVQGVVGVSADGNLELKSFYSSYGVGKVDVTAPGGDSILQRTAAAPNGRVLSTWPASLLTVTCLPARRLVDASGATYCYQQGTSMASPHAAGVAALIESRGVTARGAVAAMLENTADPFACPPPGVVAQYAFFPSVSNGAPQECTGGPGSTSWYGKGQVNALSALG